MEVFKKMTKTAALAATLLTVSVASHAKVGWSAPAQIEKMELLKGSGLMIWGKFGNSSECTNVDALWVPASKSRFRQDVFHGHVGIHGQKTDPGVYQWLFRHRILQW